MTQEYFDSKYRELPVEVISKAVSTFKKVLEKEPELEKRMREVIQRRGSIFWIDEFPMFHFGVGMFLRNKLRENGLTDEVLPDKNWDDYYIQVLEAALGFRDILRVTITNNGTTIRE
jgi:hypothetical protein